MPGREHGVLNMINTTFKPDSKQADGDSRNIHCWLALVLRQCRDPHLASHHRLRGLRLWYNKV